jgi:hypothetical protein
MAKKSNSPAAIRDAPSGAAESRCGLFGMKEYV